MASKQRSARTAQRVGLFVQDGEIGLLLIKNFTRKKRKNGKMEYRWVGPYVIHRNKGKGIYEVRKANKSTPVGSYSGSHMKLWFEGEGSSSSEEQDQSGSATGDSPDSRPQREGEGSSSSEEQDQSGLATGDSPDSRPQREREDRKPAIHETQ